MKLFETPVVEVVKFAVEDVITVSATETPAETMPIFAGPACMS